MRKNEQKQNRKRVNSQSGSQKLPPLGKKNPAGQKGPNLNGISHQDQGIVGILTEYFIKHNFLTTLDSFHRDCAEKGFKQNAKLLEAFRLEMIEAFQKGDRETFISRFAQFVPVSMRGKDIQTMKLEFYIQIYFFVYSIHPYLGKKRNLDKTAKDNFMAYLEGRGAALATSAEFLQYYALATIQKPQQNATFKSIFTKQWVNQLKKRIIYFLQKLYPSGKSSVLVQIYDKFLQRNMDKSDQLTQVDHQQIQFEIEQQIEGDDVGAKVPANFHNSRFQEQQNSMKEYYESIEKENEALGLKMMRMEQEKNQLVKMIEVGKNKYQSLQNIYKQLADATQNTLFQSQSKWFKITQEFYNIASKLLQVCESLQNGEPLADAELVKKIETKLKKYQSFINTNIDDLISENIDFSLFERGAHDVSTNDINRKNHYGDRTYNLIQLDFQIIKKVLAMSDAEFENQKCFLLEALKWRLTKTRGIMLKRQIVLSITLNDIFNFKQGEQTIKLLLHSPNQAVLLRTMQVINALCKDYYGRDYMQSQILIKNTIEVLMSEKTQENIKVIIISTLQQLSVRRVVQIFMIEGDMIRWVTYKLNKERQTMQPYQMEYSTALLINLLLRKEGLIKSQEIKEEILKTLINLMEIQVSRIRSLVHGALYPLFSKKVFREKAKQYGLQENIKFLLQNTNEESLVHQLRYIQKQLMRDYDSDEEEEQNDEDSDLDEIYDEEVGQDFQLQIQIEGEGLSGEELLIKKYSLTGPDSIKQLNNIREEAQATLRKKSVYMANSFSERPATNNPVIGQLRRNPSNNNSVYSNKSSNRILRSELNNRSQLLNKPNKNKDRLDTVQPDNSDKQMSIKDFIDERSNQDHSRLLQSQASERKNDIVPNRNTESMKQIGQQGQQRILQNQSFSGQQQQEQQNQNKVVRKQYEETQQYQKVFAKRDQIVRTPPQS